MSIRKEVMAAGFLAFVVSTNADAPAAGQSLPCGANVEGEVGVGERDHFTLTGVTVGDRITLRLTEINGFEILEVVRLYDADGEQIAWDTSEIITTLNGPEPYEVVVHDNGDDDAGEYHLAFQRLNGGPCDAPTLSCGEAVDRAIRPRGDLDSYALDGFGLGDRIHLRMVEQGEGLFSETLALYDGAGQLVLRDEPLTATLSTPGPYTLLAYEYGDDQTKDYRLTAQRLDDPCDATPLACGGYVRGSFEAIGDLDTYALGGVAQGDTLTAQTARTSPYPIVLLYDGDGSLVASDVFSVEATLSGPPPYSLLVLDRLENEIGDYSLSFQRTNGVCQAVELACGGTATGTVSTGGRAALSLTDVSAGETIELIALQTGEMNPRVKVYDGEGVILADDYSTTTLRLETTLSGPGPYSALVSDQTDSGYGTVWIAMRRLAPACAAQVVTIGETVGGELSEPVDLDGLRTDPQAGAATLCLVSTGGDLDACADVYDATGSELHACARQVYLPSAGDVNVFVRDDDFLKTGTYALRLLDGDVGCAGQDLVAPAVELSNPDGADLLIAGAEHTISWASRDDGVLVEHEIRLSTDGGDTYPMLVADGLSGAARSYAWNVPDDLATTTARIRVTAEDSDGQRGSDESDAVFNVARVPSTSRTTYEYDDLDRLTRVTYSNGSSISYSYDAVGNRTQKVVVGSCAVGASQLEIRDQTISASMVFEACEKITVGPAVTIEAGEVVLRAGESVVLEPDVSVTGGALRVEIDPGLSPP